MHVFFQPDLSTDLISLNEEESKHCIRVLRLQSGDEVHLADGNGTHATAIISNDHPKKCELTITHRLQTEPNRSYYLHVIVAPTKNMERIEWFLEKATEIGIDEISFIETSNSERNKVNMERCEKILVSAMKQSKQWYLPKLNSIVKYSEKIATATGHLWIAWCETPQTAQLSNKLQGLTDYSPKITILIGPEGDFTAAEVELAQKQGFVPVSLGNTILRTETAALYACSITQAICNRGNNI